MFEGDGIVKDYLGSLSDYAACLIEQEKEGSEEAAVGGNRKTSSYKEDKEKRLGNKNATKKMKRELGKIESSTDKLKAKAEGLQVEIDGSADEGWTVLAGLAEQLQAINDEIEEKELQWLEIAEQLEELEAESLS